ncbi:MAG: tail fiber protein [Acidobacteriia bacterium]|nr:tail fiber protein [Terriglobia bacterium]
MSSPFIGEIRMFGGNFAPAGWAFCDGSLMPISGNDALFQLIGTTYGGDGVTTFALPDLRSRVPLHAGSLAGNTYILGQSGGAETVTLTTSQIPAHSHVPLANSVQGTANGPGGNVWANSPTNNQFSNGAPTLIMHPSTIGQTGGSQPHDNMIPFLAVNFILSLFGIFPSQV